MKSLMIAVFSLVLTTSLTHASTLKCPSANLQIQYNAKGVEAIFSLDEKIFTGKIKSREYSQFFYKLNGWVKSGIEMDSAYLTIPFEIQENGKGKINVISYYEGVNFTDDYDCVVLK